MEQHERLAGVVLYVQSPEKLAEFYIKKMGMNRRVADGHVRVWYGGAGAFLEFRQSLSRSTYTHDVSDEYWKIGITLPNVDLAYNMLSEAGVAVSQPSQFQSIGYMCHLSDPEGFRIELLQHTFEGQVRTSDGDHALPLGGGAQIGQITLRTTDIEKDLALYKKLGMRLLSVQDVQGRDFELYFLAFTRERPPSRKLGSIDNRPWLWQRPYTVLELQYLTSPNTSINTQTNVGIGYSELIYTD